MLLPLFVLIEHRGRAPMLDLSIFENRLFAAATGAAFINGLSRFALMFVFVFYFQGAQGDDPITAGIKLAPLAVGMLISSPLAGWWADRRGSRALAAGGMVVTAVGLAGMTLLQADSAYWLAGVWMFVVGIGSGMFNSPNTAAMMGIVPPHRRGIAAGARMMLQNTGAILSIAFVFAVIAAAVPRDVLFKIFSGLASGLSAEQLAPFIRNMHTALWVLAAVSMVGALRVADAPATGGGRRERHGETLRIGDVARLVGTTPRTIRYYEEKGLLPPAGDRAAGQHRVYDEQDVERLRELLRMRNLLGVPLEELRELVAVDDERAVLRSALRRTDAPAERRRILHRLDALAERQLAAVDRRAQELEVLREEVEARRARIAELLGELRR